MRVAGGRFLDGRSTRAVPASLEREGGLWSVRDAGGRLLAGPVRAEALEPVPGVGGNPWLVRFPGGGLFETGPLDARARAALEALLPRRTGLLHRLESRLLWALAAVAVTAAAVLAAVRWGVPEAARLAAERLPPDVLAESGRRGLAWLDERLFAPSRLDPQRRARLAARIEALAARHGVRPPVRVRFRRMGEVANAFALPSGDVVLTDRLVALAADDEEVLAVAAHELGHLAHRHAVRQALERAALTTAVFLLAGDLSGVTGMLASLPVALVQLGYSRAMEREADAYAVRLLRAEGIPPAALARMLRRLDAAACTAAAEAKEEGAREKRAPREETGREAACAGPPAWLSTHPLTEDRIRLIENRQRVSTHN